MNFPNRRHRLSITHPYGGVIVRVDNRLALLRISKNASTELTERLGCRNWIQFSDNISPVVLFLRNPIARLISSIPETVLRVQHRIIEDKNFKDRIIISEDVYSEMAFLITRPISEFIDNFLDLIEDAPFDAHHEPQYYFFTGRDGNLRLDGHVYCVEKLESGIEKIAKRFGICPLDKGTKKNEGGKKPIKEKTLLRDLRMRLKKSGIYRHVTPHTLLSYRYYGKPTTMLRANLNKLSNKFAIELKNTELSSYQKIRIEKIYSVDMELWARVIEKDDIMLSHITGKTDFDTKCII